MYSLIHPSYFIPEIDWSATAVCAEEIIHKNLYLCLVYISHLSHKIEQPRSRLQITTEEWLMGSTCIGKIIVQKPINCNCFYGPLRLFYT